MKMWVPFEVIVGSLLHFCLEVSGDHTSDKEWTKYFDESLKASRVEVIWMESQTQ